MTPEKGLGAEADDGLRRWLAFAAAARDGSRHPFSQQWAFFNDVFAGRPAEAGPAPAWVPGRENLGGSNLAGLMSDLGLSDYRELHAWSVGKRAEFWERTIRRLGIVFRDPAATVLDSSDGPERARWLPGARISCVDSCFTAEPSRVAVITGREGSNELRRVTYGELEAHVKRFAGGLRRRGLGAGSRVALYMPMTLECVVAYLGVVSAGGVVVSIADSFPPPEVEKRLQIAGADAIVTVQRFRRGGKEIDLYAKAVEAGAPPAVVITNGSGSELRNGDIGWFDVAQHAEPFEGLTGAPDRLTNILFSSGTTGTPKAIPWTQLTPIKCAADGHFHQDIRPGDVVAWPTNIGWMMGPWLIYASLVNGATMALFQGTPGGVGFARFVERAGVTVLGVVPSLVRAWRASGACEAADWSRVRVLTSTGEPSSREDYLWLMSRTGYRAPVIEYCGGTEIGGGYITGTVVQPASPATFTTPALGLDLVVLDEAGGPVGEGEAGEVFLVPPSIGLSERLLNRDHHEVYYAGCPAGPDGSMLRRHGDLIVPLGGGFFKAAGRADDTMNLGGIKVASTELERVLESHPRVVECAAVGVPTAGEGAERLVVFAVVTGDRDGERLRRELGALVGQRLNPLFRVSEVVAVDELPRTASNKVMRRVLRQRASMG